MLLLYMLLWQQPALPAVPSVIPSASIPVDLPNEPKSHFLRDAASHIAFSASTRVVPKQGRIWDGGLSAELFPQLTLSLGVGNGKFAAGVIIRPVPRKR